MRAQERMRFSGSMSFRTLNNCKFVISRGVFRFGFWKNDVYDFPHLTDSETRGALQTIKSNASLAISFYESVVDDR